MEPNKVLYSMTVMYGRPYARERRARDRRRAQEHADRQERDLVGGGGGERRSGRSAGAFGK
jgi:hypothetical protein